MASQVKPTYEPMWKEPRQFPKRFLNGFPVGPRTQLRAKHNAKLNKLGIRHCEVRISPHCAGNRMLTWAHSKKSRFLVNDTDWMTAARCCLPCHDVLDNEMSHAQMEREVKTAIAKRKKGGRDDAE
jgi:hypothetical protein